MMAVRTRTATLFAGVLLAVGCGGSSPSAPSTPAVELPTQVSFTSSPGGVAIVGVTQVHYTGSATGSGLTYSWSFGDGTTATGQNVSHIFMQTGNWDVVLTVSNSAGAAPAVGAGSLVNTITGDWAAPVNGNGFSWHFDQNGRNFTGTDTSLRPDGHVVKGTLTDPRQVTFEEGGNDYVFYGTVEKGLDSMDLTWNSPDGPQDIRLVRQ